MIDDETRKIHLAYKNMRRRCENHLCKEFRNYGARGIFVCREWMDSRDSFVDWAKSSGHKMNLSLDRINNDDGYSPDNCRWATRTEQLRNQRRNILISFDGVTRTKSEWAEVIGVSLDVLSRRIDVYRMPLDKALTPGLLNRSWKHGSRIGYEKWKCRCVDCRAANSMRARAMRLKKKSKLVENEIAKV